MAVHPGNKLWGHQAFKAKHSPPKLTFTLEDIGKSSLTWPPAWRKVVSKVEVIEHKQILLVFPTNPEWTIALAAPEIDLGQPMPSPYLAPVEFTSIEDVDAWVKLINRMEKD